MGRSQVRVLARALSVVSFPRSIARYFKVLHSQKKSPKKSLFKYYNGATYCLLLITRFYMHRLYTCTLLIVCGLVFGVQVVEAASAITVVTPASGSVIGSQQHISWNEVEGATEYWIELSRVRGGRELYNKSTGDSPSVVLYSLPQDGSTVYMRIWYFLNTTWKYVDVTYKAGTGAIDTGITNVIPESGTTLPVPPGNNFVYSFYWTGPVDVEEYWVYAGTSVGGSNVYNASVGRMPSFQIRDTVMPMNGNTLYVRIWYRLAGFWRYKDVTYITPVKTNSNDVTSIVTYTPSQTGTKIAAVQDFSWNQVTRATEYWVELSKTKGGRELYSRSTGTKTSVTISGIPQDGSKLFLRIWYYTPSTQWGYKDIEYVAGGDSAGGLSSVRTITPMPGSTLFSETQLFSWNQVANATEYWVEFSRVKGGKELYNQSVGTRTSVTITNIPLSGPTFYMRIWYKVNGVWKYDDVTYRAEGVASADVVPPIISNLAVSAIASTSATIVWNTNEPTDAKITYGYLYYYQQYVSSIVATTHEKTLIGLQPDTLYTYFVTVKDAAGNMVQSPARTFRTASRQ